MHVYVSYKFWGVYITQTLINSSLTSAMYPKPSAIMMEQCCLHFPESNLYLEEKKKKNTLKYSGSAGIEVDEIIGYIIYPRRKLYNHAA